MAKLLCAFIQVRRHLSPCVDSQAGTQWHILPPKRAVNDVYISYGRSLVGVFLIRDTFLACVLDHNRTIKHTGACIFGSQICIVAPFWLLRRQKFVILAKGTVKCVDPTKKTLKLTFCLPKQALKGTFRGQLIVFTPAKGEV